MSIEPRGLHLLSAEQRWYYAGTLVVLETLERHGFLFKRLVEVDPAGHRPTWQSTGPETGRIWLGGCTEPGLIAHEMGHGVHERWRETPRHGDDFANAIRWFVEQRTGPTPWCDRVQTGSKNTLLLRLCQFRWHPFLALLRAGESRLPSAICHLPF